MAFLQDHQSVIIFFQKGKLVLRSLLSEGRYFRGDSHFRDSLTSVTFYATFGGSFASFEGSLLSELPVIIQIQRFGKYQFLQPAIRGQCLIEQR